ncbi:PRK06851 family protein [Sporohalobacter salinus]|uniref:PRK06851 family protein n=1 Tax=Sporohalobacter salinus TaxID=1494606 RepID=UPI0019612B2F|nr:PRK06851 family protein [Sporohalobacter salinus]MBM7623898.1 DNA replication protein DnaC [Sporohalobacter salinus]
MEKGSIINFFPGGNTAQGFYSFYNYLPYNADHVFIIKGGPGTGKSTFMKKIGQKMIEEGYDIEFHWCSSDNNSLDGVVIKDLQVAFLDGTAPHLIDPEDPGAVDEIINLGRYWNRDLLKEYRKEIKQLNSQIWDQFQQAYDDLAIAKSFYDKWKSHYIEALDSQKVDRRIKKLKTKIFDSNDIADKRGEERRLFASALTPQGPVNYLNNITKNIEKRYILKGKPGSGKERLTEEIAEEALKQGYKVYFYHCAFDPEKIDTIIIPELDTALINGTLPHKVEPKQKNDKIINMLDCIDQQMKNKFETNPLEAEKNYQDLLSKAISKIAKAKSLHDDLEEYYIEAMDFTAIDNLREKIVSELLNEN